MDSERRSFGSSILRKLFSKKTDNQPLVSGKLETNESFKAKYSNWRSSQKLSHDLENLQEGYSNSNAFDKYHPGFQYYGTDKASGFYFNPQLDISSESFDFLLEYFKESILKEPYNLYTSDKRIKEVETGVQEIDRHYLKPNNLSGSTPLKQEFGNILIELVKLDGQVQYLKLMANVYSDRNFDVHRPFEQLLELLFNESKK